MKIIANNLHLLIFSLVTSYQVLTAFITFCYLGFMSRHAKIQNLIDNLKKPNLSPAEFPVEMVRIWEARAGGKNRGKEFLQLLNSPDFNRKLGIETFSKVESSVALQFDEALRGIDREVFLFALEFMARQAGGFFFMPTALEDWILNELKVGKKSLVVRSDYCLFLIPKLAKKFPKTQFTVWLELKGLFPLAKFLFAEFQNVELAQGDFLANPFRAFEFDTVLHVPALGRKRNFSEISPVLGRNLSEELLFPALFTDHAEKTEVFVLVSEGFMFSSGMASNIRLDLVMKRGLRKIVSFPPGILKPYSGVSLNLLLFSKKGTPKQSIPCSIVELKPEFKKFPFVDNLTAFNFEVSYSQLLEAGVWTLSRFWKQQGALFEINENTVPLSQLTDEIFRGAPIVKSKSSDEVSSKIKIIEYSDLKEKISPEDVVLQPVTTSSRLERYELEDGDILITARGAKVKTGVFKKTGKEKVYPSPNLAVIRPDAQKVDSEFLCKYLSSPTGILSVESIQTGSVLKALSVKDLGSISIPLPDIQKQRVMVEKLKKAEEQYKEAVRAAEVHLEKAREQFYKEMGVEISENKTEERAEREDENFNFLEELKKL